jgi:hypothetical protein
MSWGCHQCEELLVFQCAPARHAGVALCLRDTVSGDERARGAASGSRATGTRRILHVRSDQWPKWACRRAPAKRRGTARTLAGSVRFFEINYTAVAEFAYLPRKPSRRRRQEASPPVPPRGCTARTSSRCSVCADAGEPSASIPGFPRRGRNTRSPGGSDRRRTRFLCRTLTDGVAGCSMRPSMT